MRCFKGLFSLEVGIDGNLQMLVLVTHGGTADVRTQLKEKSLTLGVGFTKVWDFNCVSFCSKIIWVSLKESLYLLIFLLHSFFLIKRMIIITSMAIEIYHPSNPFIL